jgi:hypothetical protein
MLRPRAIITKTLRQIVNIVRWLVIARVDRKVSLKQALLITAAVTVVGLTLDSARLRVPSDIATYDAHAFWSMDLAFNWKYCGRMSVYSPRYDLTHYLIAHNAELRSLSLSGIVERIAGSTEQYCSTATEHFLNSENALFYFFSALLRVDPGVTLEGVGALLIWIRVSCLIFFVFTLVLVGASPLFSLVALMLGVEISGLSAPTHLYSGYPFLLPFLGIYASLLALTLQLELHRQNRLLAVATTLIGLFGGLFYNLRTSYLPIIVGCYLPFVAFIVADAPRTASAHAPGRWNLIGIALTGFLVGGIGAHMSLTYPLTRSGATFNYDHHAVIHPLVLSLDLPPNALSQREGIRWADAVGLDLARRVDPGVSFMGPTYERTLLRYYVGLWRHYPREMLRIYFDKWRLSTTGSVTFVDDNMSPLAKQVFGPLRYVKSGIGFTLLFLVTVIVALVVGRTYSPGAAILVATVAGTGFFVTVESALIMPFFYLQYHNAQLFALFFVNLVVLQILVNAASWIVGDERHRRAA